MADVLLLFLTFLVMFLAFEMLVLVFVVLAQKQFQL